MTRPNASLALPPGDRDELPFVPPGEDATSPVAGREPIGLSPDIELHLPRIERALSDGAQAFVDMMTARARGDWPVFEAAAQRLGTALQVDLRALSNHVARAVKVARVTERQLQQKE